MQKKKADDYYILQLQDILASKCFFYLEFASIGVGGNLGQPQQLYY